jgi:RND family efflux transporter MFP subunit
MRSSFGPQASIVVLLLSTGGGVAGCKRAASDQTMPPASGPGAAPLPKLPTIEKLPAVGGGAAEGTTVAASQGRTTGTTFPRAEAQIGPTAQGIISKIFVKEGDRVRRGMVLFKQDSRDAVLRMEQAKAALAAAKVNLSAAETEHKRTAALFEQKAANLMQSEQAQTRLDAAKVGVQQAQVALDMAEKAVADTTVRSPIDGVVNAKLKSEGEMATMMPPTVVLVVQDQSTLELRLRLPESELTRLRKGDVITAKFAALGVERQAKIVRIQTAVDPATRTLEYVAEIPNTDRALRPGLLAEVELEPARAAAAASPSSAPASAAAPSQPKPKPTSVPAAAPQATRPGPASAQARGDGATP